MERPGAHDGKMRRTGRLQTAEKEVMIVYALTLGPRSSPDRYAPAEALNDIAP